VITHDDARAGAGSTQPAKKFSLQPAGGWGMMVCLRTTPANRREALMQFLLLVYTDPELMQTLPQAEFDRLMHGCITHADGLRADGCLRDAQQLEAPATARTVRIRDGVARVTDGPFAETKEVLAGFNLIEADSLEEAVRLAHEWPWIRYGSIEVRPVRDFEAVRRRVGA
jgi:hypothetical protein